MELVEPFSFLIVSPPSCWSTQRYWYFSLKICSEQHTDSITNSVILSELLMSTVSLVFLQLISVELSMEVLHRKVHRRCCLVILKKQRIGRELLHFHGAAMYQTQNLSFLGTVPAD